MSVFLTMPEVPWGRDVCLYAALLRYLTYNAHECMNITLVHSQIIPTTLLGSPACPPCPSANWSSETAMLTSHTTGRKSQNWKRSPSAPNTCVLGLLTFISSGARLLAVRCHPFSAGGNVQNFGKCNMPFLHPDLFQQ